MWKDRPRCEQTMQALNEKMVRDEDRATASRKIHNVQTENRRDPCNAETAHKTSGLLTFTVDPSLLSPGSIGNSGCLFTSNSV